MPTGSTRSLGGLTSVTVLLRYFPCWYGNANRTRWLLNIQEPNVLGITGDEGAPCLDVLAHQHAEQFVSRRSIIQGDLEQHPLLRVHRGVPQLLRVHLTQALEPLDRVLGQLLAALDTGRDQAVALAVGVGVLELVAAPLDLVQRGLGE